MVDALSEVIVEVRFDHVGLVADEERHDELHASPPATAEVRGPRSSGKRVRITDQAVVMSISVSARSIECSLRRYQASTWGMRTPWRPDSAHWHHRWKSSHPVRRGSVV